MTLCSQRSKSNCVEPNLVHYIDRLDHINSAVRRRDNNIFYEHRPAIKLGLLHLISKTVRLPSKRSLSAKPLLDSSKYSAPSTLFVEGHHADIKTREQGLKEKADLERKQRKRKLRTKPPVIRCIVVKPIVSTFKAPELYRMKSMEKMLIEQDVSFDEEIDRNQRNLFGLQSLSEIERNTLSSRDTQEPPITNLYSYTESSLSPQDLIFQKF